MSRKMPPFNDLAQPNMSRAAEAIMQEAMRKSCAEQARQMNKTMEDHEKRQIQETDKEKSLVDWTPEHEYETIKCNKTPEEAESIMKEGVKEFCDEQDKKIGEFDAKEVVDMIVRDYGDVLRKLSKT